MIRKALLFDHFDDEDFTTIIQSYTQPGYTQVNHTTLRRDALKMWRMAREKMILGFQEHRYGVCRLHVTFGVPLMVPDFLI